MSKKKPDKSCPCGIGKRISDCCMSIIDGTSPALSAEALMRSRYTAHVMKNERYLLDSWHHTTRPESIDMNTAEQWIRLKILASDNDNVEFIATYRLQGKAYRLHEDSRFIFEDGRWFYLDGDIL